MTGCSGSLGGLSIWKIECSECSGRSRSLGGLGSGRL